MSNFNTWFLSLEKGRQEILMEDKWRLAENAFNASSTPPPGYKLVPAQPGDWLFSRIPSEGKRIVVYNQYKTMLKAVEDV